MDGTNSNQNKPQGSQVPSQNQKPGLSWTQPAANTQNQNRNMPKAAPAGDSTGRVIGTIVGVVVVFALAAWGIVALRNQSASNEVTMATSTSDIITPTSSDTETPAPAPVSPTPTPATPTPITVTPVPSPVMVVSAGNASVTVPTPQDAGSAVSFSELTIIDPTWVVVYESVNGAPANILGAGLFFKGDTAGSVPLVRATVAGHDYFVSLAVDNGDKNFVKANEKYVSDSTGAQMLLKFSTR